MLCSATSPTANRQFAKVRKHQLRRTDIDEEIRKDNLIILNDAKKTLCKILKIPLTTSPSKSKLNVDFTTEFIKVVPGFEEAAEILKNGAKIDISEKKLWEGALNFKNEHQCFLEPVAIRNFLNITLEELQAGQLLGPFCWSSTLYKGKPIFTHRSGMTAKKGRLWERLIRDFTISGLNLLFTELQKKTFLPQTTDVVRFLTGAFSFFLLD